MRTTVEGSGLAAEIERCCSSGAAALTPIATAVCSANSGLPLAIKYLPVRLAGHFTGATSRLRISTSPGFTWGNGSYVAPLRNPISSAMYGRIGVISEYDPTGWRVFDARQPFEQSLYLRWIQTQPLYRALALTVHSEIANQFLRGIFRTRFRIDCVLFPPDQGAPGYTTASDVWLAVTDWDRNGEIASGDSHRLANPRFTVLVEEEFDPDDADLFRKPLLAPALPATAKGNSVLAAEFLKAYDDGDIVRLYV